MNKNIAIIAAHPDDEVIGCAGTILNHISKGEKVNILFLADGESSRYDEINNECQELINRREKLALEAGNLMGVSSVDFLRLKDNQLDIYNRLSIIKKIEKFLFIHKPETIYTHFGGDLNIDHQIIFKAVMTAARPSVTNNIKNIYSFEIQSSTELSISSNKFHPNMYVDITEHINKKKLLLNIYQSEMNEYPSSRSIENIIGKNSQRGAEVCVEFAEAFIINRRIETF